jgi:uncharacterized protein (DUF924 family)
MIASGSSVLIREILSFWFGDQPLNDAPEAREAWFNPTPEFDREIADRFLVNYDQTAAGDLDDLMGSAEGCLALVILLDQFPRNMFRGTARAFAADGKALAVARHALDKGFDASLPPVACLFLYLPFEHSEDRADQERSVALFEALGNAHWLDYAVRHRDIVARFGRFPHRNALLGRTSTAEEEDFLTQPGSSF